MVNGKEFIEKDMEFKYVLLYYNLGLDGAKYEGFW